MTAGFEPLAMSLPNSDGAPTPPISVPMAEKIAMAKAMPSAGFRLSFDHAGRGRSRCPTGVRRRRAGNSAQTGSYARSPSGPQRLAPDSNCLLKALFAHH